MLDGIVDRFSLPDIARLARRTVITSAVIAVVGLVAAILLKHPLAGVGGIIGVTLGIANFRMITASVVKVGKRQTENKRRPLAMNTLGRLAIISAIALGLFFVNYWLGFGVLAGLAVFQFVLLSNVVSSMYKSGMQSLRDPGRAAGGKNVVANPPSSPSSTKAPEVIDAQSSSEEN